MSYVPSFSGINSVEKALGERVFIFFLFYSPGIRILTLNLSFHLWSYRLKGLLWLTLLPQFFYQILVRGL
jgi:hypothetical protein